MSLPPKPELSNTALFLDIDGTLVEHAAHPDAVIIAPELPGILRDLNQKLEGAVAFVTGRNLAMVDRLFGQIGLAAAGTFGIERMHGEALESGHEAAETVAPVFADLEKRFSQVRGVYFEYKGPVLAIHTRGAPEALPAFIAVCRQTLPRLPSGYCLVEGHAGVEFLPEGATKSAAIAWFMQRPPFRGRIPVFLGDDTSDETGFEWTNQKGGISIRIGPDRPTHARHKLATVTEVHDWLKQLARSS